MDKNKSFIYRLDLNRFDTWYLDLLEQTLLSQSSLYAERYHTENHEEYVYF